MGPLNFSNHLLIEKDIRRRNLRQFFKVIVYKKSKPFIYIHEQKKMYGFSIIVGIILTAISSLIQLGEAHRIEFPRSTVLTQKSFESIIGWTNRVCDYEPCIRRIGIFPSEILVEFNTFVTPRGCHRLKKGVVKCLNEQLFTDY